ncbi:mitochondrial genome maintenance MGM101 [Ceraceosorus guamensis]|uniref:Mitochondrial genome maintenance protein MGM101 n=1 Tax=Ceraceosorus guamensis TaxID=1522189 RepID=A0A316VVR8_9BASI|nr:mitochondrial genome maintenance MGM101 [Ceraceosorus guamensis]PWN41590.1 mitochondrial genome maintenance MGM101 [Ceraceosorus guamensis]
MALRSFRGLLTPSSASARVATPIASVSRRHATTKAAPARPSASAASTPAASSPNSSTPTPASTSNPVSSHQDLSEATNGEPGGTTLGENWATSFAGMSVQPFDSRIADVLEAPIKEEDVEIKPDGLLYLPEIKYRRVLNRAFGPGGWGLAPRGETNVGAKIVSREWALVCLGRFVATARGEQEYFDPSGVATASEAAKSNALVRCCKDLGIAHELWTPRWIDNFKSKHCVEVWAENATTGRKRKLWRRKDASPFQYPNKEVRS